MEALKLKRLGTIMEPDVDNPMEAGGVLNPAAARGKDGNLYLFPRIATKENYSRISIVKVLFNNARDPTAVERLGIALEPEADYEKRPDGGGGCEDPRVTYVEPLERYIMTYTAFSPDGPRIAMAQSENSLNWERLGRITYKPYENIEFNHINNKDAYVFLLQIPSPHGHRALGMLHRPLFPGTSPEEKAANSWDKAVDKHHESIWLFYCHIHPEKQESRKWDPAAFTSHRPLAVTVFDWEKIKIGSGTPPVMTKFGWMFMYHGVHASQGTTPEKQQLIYFAGLMFLSADDPYDIAFRSFEPVLVPTLPEERVGVIANVVSPTGIHQRSDIGMPNRYDVYYGMADNRIGVARLDLPQSLEWD
ncbi:MULTISPECIES: glycosidase [unclassified Mucilaginibacter]|uniref:glycoside hydrolase family 130 protein n=1 Tax=unclassified Mucilaginibacter TaxID=2617802 RepID=UPI002AC8ACD5|nr:MULTISPECIES: glycosidase [unclassified Mucilaginibacter]MEB0263203.1 glycosidase [Mucilaginibacter sp. 10I4]MEB0280085.1 glycosidase [Mucilaginibacter sp. 10B2]MEB0301079.1 glycosidase [Mucilaginibacter sp. 5C4]WPX24507.1 glycosidase [Mucilaginibacter sp. 5C4]